MNGLMGTFQSSEVGAKSCFWEEKALCISTYKLVTDWKQSRLAGDYLRDLVKSKLNVIQQCFCGKETLPHTRLHYQECSQWVARSDSSPLFCAYEAMCGVLCPVWDFPV